MPLTRAFLISRGPSNAAGNVLATQRIAARLAASSLEGFNAQQLRPGPGGRASTLGPLPHPRGFHHVTPSRSCTFEDVGEASYLPGIRTSYDTVADDYARLVSAPDPWEWAALTEFAALVRAAGDGLVVDVGCGPGRLTARLQQLGVTAFGVDLSPGMIRVAREAHPRVRFAVGSMNQLDLADGEVGGVLSWWSIVHTPPDELPAVFGEFHRVLAPGGYLMLGFHAGNQRRHKDSGYGGHPMSVDVYRFPPEEVTRWATSRALNRTASRNSSGNCAEDAGCAPTSVALSAVRDPSGSAHGRGRSM